MKSITLILLLTLSLNSFSQKACDIFTVEDLCKATFLKDAELRVFMESKGFVLTPDTASKATIYKYIIIPKSGNATAQTLILKRYGSQTYLCSPQDAVMLSYVTLLQSNITISGVGSYSTTTTYNYKDIFINIEQYKEKSAKYGRYFMKVEYTVSNDY